MLGELTPLQYGVSLATGLYGKDMETGVEKRLLQRPAKHKGTEIAD